MIELDATSLNRIMQCGASRTMPGFVSGMGESDSQREGNAAHWLAMECLRTGADIWQFVDRKAPNGFYITSEMAEHVEAYRNVLVSRGVQGPIGIEDYMSFQVKDLIKVNCRPDWWQYDVDNNFIYIDDFKYGFRPVEINDNYTMLAYALAISTGLLVNRDTVFVLTIHQPRPYHIDGPVREWRFRKALLDEMRLTINNTLEFTQNVTRTGPNCYKCQALANCPAARKAAMTAIDYAGRAFDESLPNEEIDFELDQIDRAIQMLKDRKAAQEEIAEHRIKSGQRIPNRHIKQDPGNMQWRDYVNAELLDSVTKKDLRKPAGLITPTQAKKAGVNPVLLDTLAYRPLGKAKLVKIDDNKHAQRMFNRS